MNKRPKRVKSPGTTGTARVGYGCPPTHSRFAPGRSGNARGRPKGSRNLHTIIRDALTAKIVVREGEKMRSVSKLEGIVLKQTESALRGSDRAALATLKIAAQVGLLDAAAAGSDTVPLSNSEQAMLDELLSQTKPKRRSNKRG